MRAVPTTPETDAAPRDGRRSAAAARRRAREAEIVAATRRLFDEKGVREAQIEDIARAVGINRAIVYRHFTGKEDLFALTMVSYLVELGELLEAAARKARTPETRLAAVVTTFADFALAHPAFVDCAQALLRRPGNELLDEVSERALLKLGGAMVTCLGSLSRVIEGGVAAGNFQVKDATLLANTLYASGLGALMLARSGLVIRESAPGVPAVGQISAEQVKQHMVATALAAARGHLGRPAG
jgi:AcrR family transcriptional regulator